jgi:hypothetical protein
MRLRCAAVCAISAGAALAITVSVTQVRRPLVQAWSTCLSCRYWCTLCALLCVRGRGVLARERGAMTRACACAVVCAVCGWAALETAVSVTRVWQPLVQAWFTCLSCRYWSTLCALLCVRGRGVLARERGAMTCACACACAVVCAVCGWAALDSAVSVTRVRQQLVQAWFTCLSCRYWSTLCARLCVRGGGVCLHGNAGQ